MKDIKWGTKGNIADNGCGIIAAYNVLLHYSSSISFSSVLNALKKRGGPIIQRGKMGLNPFSLTNYLRTKFWNVKTASSWTYLWGIKAELSECVIVLYALSKFNGAHYIAGINTGLTREGGSFKFYNFDNKSQKYRSIWTIIDEIRKGGGTPIAFWGVKNKKGRW